MPRAWSGSPGAGGHMFRDGGCVSLVGVGNEGLHSAGICHIDIPPSFKDIVDTVGTLVQAFRGKAAEQSRGVGGIACSDGHVTARMLIRQKRREVPLCIGQRVPVRVTAVHSDRQEPLVSVWKLDASGHTGLQQPCDSHDCPCLPCRIVG